MPFDSAEYFAPAPIPVAQATKLMDRLRNLLSPGRQERLDILARNPRDITNKRERLEYLAAFLPTLSPHEFRMASWDRCVSGWTNRLWPNGRGFGYSMPSADVLGLSDRDAHVLFLSAAGMGATRKKAASVIRNYLNTGHMTWR